MIYIIITRKPRTRLTQTPRGALSRELVANLYHYDAKRRHESRESQSEKIGP